jgi:cell division transport system permease protein
MTFARALAYFATEAFLNLLRSWKVSLVAILTIGVSLFVGGVFQLASSNLAEQLEQWRRETKAILYLQPGLEPSEIDRLTEEVQAAAAPWITSLTVVDQATAQERFRKLFPSLSELADDWGQESLPASIEVGFDPRKTDTEIFERWLAEARDHPQISMADDDRDWLGQLETAVLIVRGTGLGLGLVLLAAAIFTIASVVRLTAYLYQEEIDIMRLVGATEFFIRGPFYLEGLLQGLLGALLAAGGLFAAQRFLAARFADQSQWAALLTGRFLSPAQLITLLALGTAAGLFGAIISLRREKLGEAEP